MTENLKQKEKAFDNKNAKVNNQEKNLNEKVKRGFRHIREQRNSKNIVSDEKNIENNKKKSKSFIKKNNEIIDKKNEIIENNIVPKRTKRNSSLDTRKKQYLLK